MAPCAHWSLCFRCKSAGGYRKWPDAAGPKRAREGLQPDQQTAVPADGRARGLECPRDNIRCSSHPISDLLVPNVRNEDVEISVGILSRMVGHQIWEAFELYHHFCKAFQCHCEKSFTFIFFEEK